MKTNKIITGFMRSKLFNTPFYVHLYVTKRCNLQCKMCNVWKFGNKQEEMSLEDIKDVATKLKKLKVPNIVVTGGEPFLRQDLPEIIKILSKDFSVRIQTNGSLVNEDNFNEVVKAGVNDITTSIDTLDKTKFDELCNGKGVLGKAVNTLRLAVEKLPNGINLANTTISRMNVDEVEDIIKFVHNLGAYSSLVSVNLSESKDMLFRGFAGKLAFSNEDRNKIEENFKKIFRMKKQGYRIISSMKYLKDSLKVLRTHNPKWKCYAGRLFFVIYPNGGVAPCDDFGAILNIKDKDFVRKFKSKDYINKVKQIENNCRGCTYGCWREIVGFIKKTDVQLERLKTFLGGI